MVQRFVPVVELLRARLEADDVAPRPRAAAWIEAGVPAAIAQRVDAADGLFAALDVAEVASATQREVGQVAEVQVALGDVLPLASLRQQIAALPTASYWQSLARMALGDDLADLQRLIADAVVRPGAGSGAQMLAAWQTRNRVKLDRAQRLLSELAETQDADLAMLSVALRELRNLV